MNKNNSHSYKSNSQNAYLENTKERILESNLYYSPFRKNLPVIFETENSPHKEFDVQQLDYLQEEYESRLIDDEYQNESTTEYSFPNDSRLLNLKQKQLVNKIYEKQKQLVMLEQRIYLLKNTNECLRETIQEQKLQKIQLHNQIDSLEKENTLITQKLKVIQQKLHRIQTQEIEQQKFALSQNINPQSKHELIKQNVELKQQIQGLKQFYEEEIYQIINRNQTGFAYLQEKLSLSETQANNLKNNNQLLQSEMQRLNQQLQNIMLQKKQMLEYYLQIIDDMNREITELKRQSHTISEQILSANYFQNDDSYMRASKQNTMYLNNNDLSRDKTINVQRLLQNNDLNQLLSRIIKNSLTKQLQQSSKNYTKINIIKKSDSTSSLIHSEKPHNHINLNTTFVSQKQTQRFVSNSNSIAKNTQHLKALSQLNSKPSKFKQNLSKGLINNHSLIQTSAIKRQTNISYNKKHQTIDKKLQQIKQKLTKQLFRNL